MVCSGVHARVRVWRVDGWVGGVWWGHRRQKRRSVWLEDSRRVGAEGELQEEQRLDAEVIVRLLLESLIQTRDEHSGMAGQAAWKRREQLAQEAKCCDARLHRAVSRSK